MGFRVIWVDESMCWSMPKVNKVIPAEDEAFVMQTQPKIRHSSVEHLMGKTLQMQQLTSCLKLILYACWPLQQRISFTLKFVSGQEN